ncbi:MAG: minor capsid protein [Sedimentibacter sp.]|uniref:minor capsid protein n=1 Tax=Sedimentibacter sp. TaxID=1960295 RepID=UPI003158BDA7
MSNQNNYWQARLSDAIFKKNTKELQKQLIKYYKQASKTIENEIAELYVKMLADGEISANTLYSFSRYRNLQEAIEKETYKLGKLEIESTQLTLLDSYKEIYLQTNEKLDIAADWTILNENIAKEVVNANFKGAKYSDRIWTNKAKLKQQIEKSIVDTVIAGQSKDKAVISITNNFGVAFSDADRLVRTETMRVLNDGQKQSYLNNGYSKVEWLVEDDDRLCDECSPLDGKIFDINAVPSIVHPNCRCTFIPVIE